MLTQVAEFERYKTRAHALLKKADENGGGGGRDITGTRLDKGAIKALLRLYYGFLQALLSVHTALLRLS
jgi:hypothetical protein